MIHADLHSHSLLSDCTLTPEALVDALVYELYGLTDEEIKIVEGGA